MHPHVALTEFLGRSAMRSSVAHPLREAGDVAVEDWAEIRLGDLFDHVVDVGHAEQLPILSVTLHDGVIHRSSLKRKSDREVAREKHLRAITGDLAYNTMRMWQGASGLVREEGYLSPAYTVCRPRSGESPEFWAHCFKWSGMVQRFRDHSQGLTKDRLRLYFRHFANVPALRPPLREQRKIAAILSAVDEMIEKTVAVIGRLQTLKKAVMRELLTRGLPGCHARYRETEAGETPEEWEVVPFGSAGKWLSGGTPTKKRAEYWGGELPWISPKDMKRPRLADSVDHVTEAAVGNGTRRIEAGTILMVVRGMILAHSFPVALTTAPATFNQDIKAVRPNSSIDPEYLLYWLESQESRVVAMTAASSHGTRRVSTDALKRLPLPLPTRDEQARIAAAVRSVDTSLDCHLAEVRHLKSLKNELASALLTGAVRVNPDEDAA